MARLTIEDCWWTDPRRELLAKKLGGNDPADIAAIRAWRLAQEFWKRDRQLVPKALFESLGEASQLLGVGLAELRGEMIYVRGSSAYLDWIAEKRELAKEAGHKGGVISAQRPRDALGRLLPKIQAQSKQDPSSVQADPSVSKPSCSFSSSSEDKEKYLDATNTRRGELFGAIPELSFDPEIVSLLEQVRRTTQTRWFKLYPAEWIPSQLMRIVEYLETNPMKRPKISPARFIGGWLSRGWEDHRRRLPSDSSRQRPFVLKTIDDLESETGNAAS